MTEGLAPAPFATTPRCGGRRHRVALERGAHIVWSPRRLRVVAAALDHLPRTVYRRLVSDR